MFNAVLRRNTVLCVSSDTGLCYVPIVLAKHMASTNSGRKRIVFLTPDGESDAHAPMITTRDWMMVSVFGEP